MGDGGGDHHPLPLSTGQTVRILVKPLIGAIQSHPFEQGSKLPSIGPRGSGLTPRFLKLGTYLEMRGEGGQRLLKDESGLISADIAKPGFTGADQFLAT
ncbi:hypothetical protein ACFB49_41260 [Sphingomonas sp. DBB INV C78]